jgi:hypothetical protein
MPKSLAKGGKPARVDTSAALLEANKDANNNPKLIKLPITSIGEWSDADQAFVITVDISGIPFGFASPTIHALIPKGSPFLSSSHNLLTKSGHPTGKLFFNIGDIALCEKKINTVTVEETKFLSGVGHGKAKYKQTEVVLIFVGWECKEKPHASSE